LRRLSTQAELVNLLSRDRESIKDDKGGGGLPSPATAVIPVEHAVLTTPSGANGGAARPTPSLPSPVAALIAIAIVDVNAGEASTISS